MSALRMAARGERGRGDRASARRRGEERPRAARARARRVSRAHGDMRFLSLGPVGYPLLTS
jgi:hypothetical protein